GLLRQPVFWPGRQPPVVGSVRCHRDCLKEHACGVLIQFRQARVRTGGVAGFVGKRRRESPLAPGD
ncbi:MAG: hypothetical protein WAM71_11365, partial [Candidatus Korobacteraceae bacterium]